MSTAARFSQPGMYEAWCSDGINHVDTELQLKASQRPEARDPVFTPRHSASRRT